MRKTGFSLLSLVAGVCLLQKAAFAQEAPAAPAAPAPAAAPAAAPAPAPAPAPAAEAPAAPAAEAPAAAPAAPPAPTYPLTTITGAIEGGYHRVLAAPHNVNFPVPTRAYDTSNGFQLHVAHLALKHQMNEHVYGVIEFDAGSDAKYNQGTNAGNTVAFGTEAPKTSAAPLFDVQEAYGVATGEGLTFTVGKFATYEGIELIEGWTNPTVTRGFLYWLAEPVTHTGAKLHYTAGPVDVGVGVVNGWDTNNALFNTGDNNAHKTLIWRLGYLSPELFAGFSGTYGVEKPTDTDPRLSLDLTGGVVVDPHFTINFQGNYGSEKHSDAGDPTKSASWFGFGLQPVYKMDAFQLGARFEYFSDKGLSRTAFVPPSGKDKVGLWNFSIAPGYTIASALLMRAEFRVDGANEEVLWNGKKTQTSLALNAAYIF